VFDRSFWSGDSPDIGVGVYMGCPGVQGVQERVDNKSSAGGGGGGGGLGWDCGLSYWKGYTRNFVRGV